MSKQHFCKKYRDNILCGEKDPEKFEKGRYSICNECKKKQIYAIQKAKKEKQKIDEVSLNENKNTIDLQLIIKEIKQIIELQNERIINLEKSLQILKSNL
jgi:hypothetical protein